VQAGVSLVLIGYNTNGFAHHPLEDALEILGEMGCQSVALTLDYHALNPFDPRCDQQLDTVRSILHRHQMRCVVETGARFLLDIRRKHRPTLLDADSSLRMDFLRRSIQIARQLDADAVSFWSGQSPPETSDEVLYSRLIAACRTLASFAANHGVRLAFEPEPGMFIDTMAKFARLYEEVNHSHFGLTLDIGHMQCMNELPMRWHVVAWGSILWNVHIEDMRTGIHDHLPFGEGDIDFPPVFAALREANYGGGLHVELSRHGHNAVETARKALEFLREHQQTP
jgi:sugar phosphate isomerase/epimerase